MASGESVVPIERRPIPMLPERPRSPAVTHQFRRSYPVGRQEFSRAIAQRPLELAFSTDDPFPTPMQALLDTTVNAPAPGDWITIPFEQSNDRTFTCRLTPSSPGLYSFRARCSVDGGLTWLRDPAPDAWVLVDPPQIDGLRMYTLIPTVSGTIADWADDLTRIKAMGFNAVHLLPVTSLDSSQSPYAASDLFDIDHSYLMDGARGDGLTQLEAFVQRARDLDIRLCFDLVLNHVGVHSTMVRRAPSWIVPDQRWHDGNKRARYWSDGAWRTWDDLVLIHYEHPSEVARAEIWRYMTEYALFWARYADYTGGLVRFDNLHSSNPGFVEACARTLHAEYPTLGVVAEYFTDEVTLLTTVADWRLNLVLATPWDYKFAPQLRKYLQYLHRISDHIRYFMPITSHDAGSTAQEFGVVESTVPRYVAAALLGTGATGITQGVECGEQEKLQFVGRQSRHKRTNKARFGDLIRDVNAILAAHPAFRCGGNCEFVDNGHDAILAAFRTNPESRAGGFLVVCNFDIHSPQRIEIVLSAVLCEDGPCTGQELLSGAEVRSVTGTLALSLAPCEAMVIQFVS